MGDDPTDPDPRGSVGDDLAPEEQHVRELLAAERPEPMPDDIAERLTLAIREHARERSADHTVESPGDGATASKTGPLRPLRRWLPATAVAAVLLAIVAVALPRMLTGEGTATSSAGRSSSASPPQRERAQPSPSPNGGSNLAKTSPLSPQTTQRRLDAAGPNARTPSRVPLRTRSFRHDVEVRVVDRGLSPSPVAPQMLDRLRCSSGKVQTSQGLAVEVGGNPARLFATGPADARTYRVISCATGAPTLVAHSGSGPG